MVIANLEPRNCAGFDDFGKCQSLPRSAEAVKGPDILGLVMAKNVIIAVIGKNAKIASLGGIPTSIEFRDLKLSSTEREASSAFVGTITRIAFDANFTHGVSKV